MDYQQPPQDSGQNGYPQPPPGQNGDPGGHQQPPYQQPPYQQGSYQQGPYQQSSYQQPPSAPNYGGYPPPPPGGGYGGPGGNLPGGGKGNSALVMGIISTALGMLFNWWLGAVPIVGIVTCLAGLALGVFALMAAIAARKAGPYGGRGIATAGLVLAIIGIVFNGSQLIFCGLCVTFATCRFCGQVGELAELADLANMFT